MAGHRGSITTVSAAWRLCLALYLFVCIVGISLATPPQVYDINLGAQSVADALTSLSEQTGVPVVFPYDLVRDRKAHPVNGHYTLPEALIALLQDTGLSGGLSDKGVLTVSLVKPAASESGETLVTNDDQNQNTNNTRLARPAGIAAFFASLAAAFSASAQEAADSTSDQTKLEQVIVTAQKHEERQQDVPIAMTVLNPEELAQNGQARLVDYFATVPGLNVNPNAFLSGTTYLTIRGLSAGINQNPTVGTVVDDVQTGSSSALEAGNLTPPDIDPSDLARIEVLKGPQGTLYGADSLGGLIKYVTVDPSTAALTGRIEVSGVDIPMGGAGYSVRAAANIPVSDTLAVRVSGFSRRDSGYVDDITSGQTNVNSVDVYGGRISAMWRPTGDVSLKVGALVQQTDGHGSAYFDGQLNGPSPCPGVSGCTGTLQPTFGYLKMTGEAFANPYTTQEQLYSATLRAKVADLDLVSVSGYAVNRLNTPQDTGSNYDLSFSMPTNYNVASSGIIQHNQTDKLSQELRLSSSIGRWLDWLVGGFYTHETEPESIVNIVPVSPATGAPGNPLLTTVGEPFSLSEEALFGDLTIHFTDRFNLQLGGREAWNRMSVQGAYVGPGVNDFYGVTSPYVLPREQASGNAFTYLASPQFKFSTDAMVYARIASGYRIGGPNPIAPTQYAAITPTDYKPDRTVNYEIGIKDELLDRRLSIDASVYYIKWSDFQLNVEYGGIDYFTTNAGNAKSEGAEFAIQARPAADLTVTAQGSYNDAALTQSLPAAAVNAGTYAVAGDRLPYSVRWSGGVTANQDIHISSDWTGFVGGAVTYLGMREGEFPYYCIPAYCGGTGTIFPRAALPGYTTINMHMGARHESWLVNLYLNNVADRRGVAGATPGTVAVGVTGGYYGTVIQPRTVGLSVARNF